MAERWERIVIKGVTLNYEVSDEGRIRGLRRGRIKNAHLTGKGYRFVSLYNPAKKKIVSYRVAPLVADAFLRPREKGEQLEHENQISTDDRLSNLKIVASQSENIVASYKAGNRKKPEPNALTQADYDRIHELWATGEYSQVAIGRLVGCTNSNVSKVLSGKHSGPRLRRQPGSCASCSRPAAVGRSRCESCLDSAREATRRWLERTRPKPRTEESRERRRSRRRAAFQRKKDDPNYRAERLAKKREYYKRQRNDPAGLERLRAAWRAANARKRAKARDQAASDDGGGRG